MDLWSELLVFRIILRFGRRVLECWRWLCIGGANIGRFLQASLSWGWRWWKLRFCPSQILLDKLHLFLLGLPGCREIVPHLDYEIPCLWLLEAVHSSEAFPATRLISCRVWAVCFWPLTTREHCYWKTWSLAISSYQRSKYIDSKYCRQKICPIKENFIIK